MSFFYAFKVNKALVDIGADIKAFDPNFKAALMAAGKTHGNSPEEVALFLASKLPLMHRFGLKESTVKGWVRLRKIDPQAEEMRAALSDLGWFDLMR